MLKALGISIMMTVIACSLSSAAVVSGNFKAVNLDMKYPLVYTDDEYAQNQINADLANIIYAMKNDYEKGKCYSAKMDYEITCETDDVVSILLKTYVVRFPGAAHGFVNWTGLVYDKKTGNRIPVSSYVILNSAEQIQTLLLSGILKSYNWNMKQNFFFRNVGYNVKNVSDNYVLGSDGSIYLIYPPYSIGPFAYGPYRVGLDSVAIDYLNRMNQNK